MNAIDLALEGLRHREWTSDLNIWSPTCLWCGGYQRSPAMDQDYYGQAGHKADCLRQRAIAALEVVRAGGISKAERLAASDKLVLEARDGEKRMLKKLEDCQRENYELAAAVRAAGVSPDLKEPK